MIWWVVLPLIMLTVYTFIFSVVFQAKWNLPQGGRANFAAMFFSGLIVFNILTESIGRAPGLIFENPSYVKKVVFPLEVLPAMVVGTALFNGLINITLLLLLYVWTIGVPPVSTCFLPIVLLPLVLTTLGLSWFLSSLGTFLRDLSQIISIACSLLMFLSPIFYPVEALPQTFRTIVEVSPLTVVIRQFREILFWGTFPSTFDVLTSWLIAFGIAWMGYSWFMLSKRAFADVV
jgi:lipopolysaccharide transport system permease protein